MAASTPLLRVARIAALTLSVVCASTPCRAFIDSLEVVPAQPDCDEPVTLSVRGWFPDMCFQVVAQRFLDLGSELRFEVTVIDVFPQPCGQAGIGYVNSAVVGPLAPGTYTLTLIETVSSIRTPGETASLPFTVACCAPPPEVAALRAVTTASGERELTWNAVPQALDYAVWEDDDPAGAFDRLVTRVTEPRALLPAAGAAYLRVTAANSCGDGPRLRATSSR